MLLEIDTLTLSLRDGSRTLLRGISLSLREGDSLTVLGMSGSGKTMLCNALLQTLDGAVFRTEGAIRFCGRDLCALRERDRLALYGGEMVYIPQNPMTAFDPSMRVGRHMTQVLRQHENLRWGEAKTRVLDALAEAGLPECGRVFASYPHQLSGGMLQRVLFAMALMARPKLVVADEPTTALDARLRRETVASLAALKQRGAAVLMTTHDFGSAVQLGGTAGVLREGELVETGEVRALLEHPVHPHTACLAAAARLEVDT